MPTMTYRRIHSPLMPGRPDITPPSGPYRRVGIPDRLATGAGASQEVLFRSPRA